MRVQGYLELDYQAMDDDEFEQFNAFLSQYMVHYKRVHQSEREYYFCIMRDVDLLPELLGLMTGRNPVVNGMWNQYGTPYGQTKIYDEDGNVTVTGEPTYAFDLDIHLSHTPTNKTYDEDGNVLTETAVTEFKPLHRFAGWEKPSEY